MRKVKWLLVAVALMGWTASRAHAADGAAVTVYPASPPAPAAYAVVDAANSDPCCLKCPRWHLTIGAWFLGLDGTVAAEGRSFDVDSDFTDSFENIDEFELGVYGRLRLETGRWRFTVGLDTATIEDSATFSEGPLDVDASLELWIAHATIGYVFAGGRMGCSPCAGTWCLDAFAGVRYWNVNLEAPGFVGAVGAVDTENDWLDPIVGLHLDLIWPKWIIQIEGDIGGFGVGSEFAWNAMASVGYRFNCNFALYAGWRVLDVDREDGDFVYDMTHSGPFFEVAFSF